MFSISLRVPFSQLLLLLASALFELSTGCLRGRPLFRLVGERSGRVATSDPTIAEAVCRDPVRLLVPLAPRMRSGWWKRTRTSCSNSRRASREIDCGILRICSAVLLATGQSDGFCFVAGVSPVSSSSTTSSGPRWCERVRVACGLAARRLSKST